MASGASAGVAATAGKEEAVEVFEHVLSGVTLETHPLLPTFRRLVQGELRRFSGSRYSTQTCHEWICVAEPGVAPPIARGASSKLFGPLHAVGAASVDAQNGGTASPPPRRAGEIPAGEADLQPVWVNLQTGQRSLEFPRLSGPEDAVFRRGNGWADKKAAFAGFYELTTLRQSLGDLPEKQVIRKRWRSARGRALARRPLTMLEVLHAAEVMGIDAFEEPELMFLCESALCVELPLGWERVELPDNTGFYRHAMLRQNQWLHPQLTYLVALAKHWRAIEAEKKAAAKAAGGA